MKYHFFWGGVFSNWYIIDFVFLNMKYNCVEQYMMHQKAIYFKDYYTAGKIMKQPSPKRQKMLGREVSLFDSYEWDRVKYNIVKEGVRAKFLQHPDLLKELKSLQGVQFVEASPDDRVWGIGYDKHSAMANISKWGQNLLGRILTELSNEL